ncbi:MAG TPA: hypothetical protein VFV19_14470 [Candidatus Polarisedimenticolaceae bacterium]|nr:hypothetical protein [Candidatus Polarisedimenticolaceae bacterium]
MSELQAKPPKDPFLRFLGGCALVAGGVLLLVMIAAIAIGWRLTRDVAPGRPVEAFLSGDETRYWCLDLKADDPGIAAFVQNVQRASEEMREETLEHSPLRLLPFRPRGNRIDELLPIKLELAQSDEGWVGRATFSKQIFRIRAAVKLIRFVIGRDPAAPAGPDGIPFASFGDKRTGKRVAMTMVGNRLLVASAPSRLSKALATDRADGAAVDPKVAALHTSIRQDGEDGWAFAPGPSVASFDVTDGDALRFRVVTVQDAAMTADEARALAHRWIPLVEDDAIELDSGTPSRRPDGMWLVEGRIVKLSERVRRVLLHATERDASGSPSATPTPPSPPRP